MIAFLSFNLIATSVLIPSLKLCKFALHLKQRELLVPLGFVLRPFWVDLVVDFVTSSVDFGVNFAIFWHCFSDVCLHCVLYLLCSTANPKANISWPGGLRGAIK